MKKRSAKADKSDVANVDMAEVQAALGRVQAQLSPSDFDLFQRLVNTLITVLGILRSQRTILARLRRLFGVTSSEKSHRILADKKTLDATAPAQDNPDAAQDTSGAAESQTEVHGSSENPGSAEPVAAIPPAPAKGKGHGRLPASMYEAATHVVVMHDILSVGGLCPNCPSGKLYELKEPSSLLRISGQPLLAATCWDCQRLRCSSCGDVHTAQAPVEAYGPKFDETAAAMIALGRYGVGLPHNRLEKLQKNLQLPIPSSTQWDVICDVAPCFEPVFAELERQAAQGDVIHSDDSHMRVLAFMGEGRAKLLAAAELPDPERVGMFTTAIVSITNDQLIALFYTGRKYAGENLSALLDARDPSLGPPTTMGDGLDSRNTPHGHEVVSSNCLTHGRRGFVDQIINFPHECRRVLDALRKVYVVDAHCKKAKLSHDERLAIHQRDSAPVMTDLNTWMTVELAEKRVEPNSDLGKAFNYMLKRWDRLTLFLRKAGAPIDNNLCERVLKMAIRHRRNSLFYRSERGAEIGDMFMSLIHTAELRGENPFDYLTQVLRHEKEVAACPADWLPWTYRETLARMAG